MKARFAFTLTEVLTCIAIVVVLAAIAFPVFGSAKRSAYESQCLSNLKQLQLAVVFYQESHGGSGQFGDLYTMNLPPPPPYRVMKNTKELGECNGDAKLWKGPNFFAYFYIPVPPGQRTGSVTWAEYSTANQDDSMLFLDLNHNPASTPLSLSNLVRKGIGITLGGRLIRKTKRGDWWDFDWWKIKRLC